MTRARRAGDRRAPAPLRLAGSLALLLAPATAGAAVTIVGTFPIQQLRLIVGPRGGIEEVTMDVPAADVGNPASPVAGEPAVSITVLARAPAGTPDFVLTVDSSAALTSGTSTIPMTEIAWTSQAGDIPSGAFDGSASQLLLQAPPNRRVVDTLRFRYLNSTAPLAGTYQGRVRYTLSVP